LLRRHCLGLIGLARRSRQLFVGFEKVRAAVASGQVGVLLAAHDGSPDGRAKVARMAPGVPVCETFSASELGHAVGGERVVHAAIAAGRFCERFLAEAARLDGICASPRPRQDARDGIGRRFG
jgi:ribosomal protein L7Ae-like RNA K-turn-binding protein